MTTDERLAALEAKLDALTAPPSDYYTSRYSGEEIDAAVAAVPGKAETTQLCNRNLLDNWYFGNPVDQRDGYVVPAGKTYYSDAACTAAAGTTTKAYMVYPLNSKTFWSYKESDHAVKFYEKAEDVIRGYVGGGYGLDRWRVSANGIITVTDTGVLLQKSSNSAYGSMYETIDATLLLGKEITIAALINDNLYAVSGTVPDTVPTDKNTAVCISARVDDVTIQSYLYASGVLACEVVNYGTGACKAGAVKLELGSQQTLAHQDADGNWVLNEIPDYGEQLRRCQRYFVRLGDDRAGQNCAAGFANCANATTGNAFISTPVSMRATPAISINNVKLRKGITDHAVTAVNPIYATKNGIYCAFTSSDLPTGETLIVRTVSGGYMDASADL